MQWHLHDLGFLPLRDPVVGLNRAEWAAAERLGADLPKLTYEQRFRAASVEYLTTPIDWDAGLTDLGDREIERLFQLYSYFASAYVHAPGLPAVDRIPAPIAVPLERLAQLLQRPPILAYASYCLHNWRREYPEGPVALGNTRLIQNFSLLEDGKEDEDWFILVHVDIEARAGKALNAMRHAGAAIAGEDATELEGHLQTARASLHDMNLTMARMPEHCRPEVYFRKVRPYIFGFTDVIYEGCANAAPRCYRGETGAQSSIVPTMLAALGVHHQDSLLTTHLADMRNYMPLPHRAHIEQQPSVRAHIAGSTNSALRELYNECLRELISFRSRHFDYAVNYIEIRVDNPLGTGGTPYVPWLRQLIEESKKHFLK